VNQGYDVVLSGGIPPNTYPAPVTLTGVYPGFEFSGGSASGYPPGGSSTNTQYRVTSTTFGGETEIYIAPSGDASGATDQTNIAAAITAACASGPPSPISIKLGSGIFYVTGDFPVGCPFDFQGAGKGNTFIEFVTTSSNFITANYGGGALNYESYGAMWSDFSLLMKSGVTAASGDAFILSGLNDEHYLAQLHINRVAMYGLWGGFSTGANMVENWFEHNYCAFFVSGGDGCLSYDTVQPGGDFHFDFNEAVGPYTGYTVLQGDVLHFNGNKLNGSPFLFYSNTSSIIDVLLTDESYEGTQACGIDFGTGGARIANVVLSSVEIGAGPVYGTTALCHVTNPQLTGLSGCYSFSAQNGGAPTCIGAPYNPNQLATYNFSVVENPLSYSGMFTAAGTGASLPQVPSAGICEPASTSSGSSAVATGFGSWPNSQSTAVVLAALGGQGSIGLILRASATTETLYQVNLDGSANLDVYAVVAGSAHQIGSTTFIPTANQMWEASVVGTTSPIINVYLNGALFYSVTDTTYGASITSGSPGFAIRDSEAITDTQISSWTGGSAGGTILATSNLSDWTNSGVANGLPAVWNSGTSKWTPSGTIDMTLVNSAGYQCSGSWGTNGQVLSTTGSGCQWLNNGFFTAGGDLSGTASSQEVTGILNNVLPSINIGYLNWTGTQWAFSNPAGAGNTTSTSLTSNRLPKANGTNSIINSSISDDATTVSTTEIFSAGSFKVGSNAVIPSTVTGYNGNASGVKIPLAVAFAGSSGAVVCDDGNHNLTESGCSAGAVASVSNSDSTLTISPTTGSVVASLNLAHANTWTGLITSSAGINLSGASAPLELAGSAGTSGNCLLSAGAGDTPTWGACSGGSGGDSITSPNSTLTVGGSSSATTLDLVGSAGEIMAGATPALTYTPSLGKSGTAGSLSLYPSSGNFTTTLSSAATASNTVKFFATVPTNLDLFYCAVSTTTCTLTDAGYAYNAIPFSDLNGNLATSQGPSSLTGILYDTTGTISQSTAAELGTLIDLPQYSVPYSAGTTSALTDVASPTVNGTYTLGWVVTGSAALAPTAINANTLVVSSASTATNATNVATTTTTSNTAYYMALLTDNATENQGVLVGSGPTYNPSTGAFTLGGSTHGLSIPAGTAVSGASGSVIYASDSTNGYGEINENNTGLSRICTAANGICAPASGIPIADVGSAGLSGSGGVSIAATGAISLASIPGSAMTNNTITATQLAAQYSKGACTEVWGGTGTSNVLQSGDDAISNNTCYNDSGVTRTITAVKCRSDYSSNTTTVNPTFGSAGTGTTILSGALTCGNSYAYSSSGTVSNASWTTGTGIDPAMGTPDTHSTSLAMIVEYTY
jgi:hypothetical protein